MRTHMAIKMRSGVAQFLPTNFTLEKFDIETMRGHMTPKPITICKLLRTDFTLECFVFAVRGHVILERVFEMKSSFAKVTLKLFNRFM